MKISRALMASFAAILITAAAGHAQEAYPSKPVKVIVPFAPGGPSDVTARIIFAEMSKNVGKQFVIENHAGGAANIGITLASRAAPDGYTVLLSSSSLWINPNTYAKVAYDPVKDFIPISLVATTPNSLVVHPSVPVKTVKELVDMLRAAPGKYTIANPGTGTPPHLSGELFKHALKLETTSVPFGGGGPMIQSVVGGHTPIAFSSMPPAAPQIKAGTIRALAVTALKRSDSGARRSDHDRGGLSRPGGRHAARHAGAGRHAAADRRFSVSRVDEGDADRGCEAKAWQRRS